jgi:hypothetical protein
VRRLHAYIGARSTHVGIALFAVNHLHLFRSGTLRAIYFEYCTAGRVYSVTGYEGGAMGYHHSLEVNS